MTVLRARDNPRVKRWAKLVRDPRFRRSEGRFLVEGPKLVAAALEAKWKIEALLVSECALAGPWDKYRPVIVSEAVFNSVVDSEAPQGVAAELTMPSPALPKEGSAVFLEGVQDPGNVGTILRSAAAFGVRSAVLDRACADPWSPKVLRAGAGAHFALSVAQAEGLKEALQLYRGKTACTVPRGGTPIGEADLAGDLGWIFGAEGQGVSSVLRDRSQLKISIPCAIESLNVAAAAAICFYVSRPGAGS